MSTSFWNYEKLKKGVTSAVTVAAGVAARGLEVAKDLAEDLTSFKALKDYKLAGHVATAGPGGCWRVFSAVNKKPGGVFPEAAVWILDKKALTDQASRAGRARGFDTFFEQQRRGCSQLVKLKHPGVIKVIEPLEETGGQMVFVTEPVFGSLADVLGGFRDVPSAQGDRAGAVLSPLEAKYGLQCVAETLHFLHHEARLVHANINPGSVIVARDGGWKLAGFEFVSSSADGFGGSSAPQLCFEYASAHPSPWEEYSQPPLGFTAPELVGGSSSSSGSDMMSSSSAAAGVGLSGAADCFSLAALTYLLVAGKELLPVGSSTGEYRSRLRMLSAAGQLQGVPPQLQAMLQGMLSTSPSARPNAAAFSGCQWFSEDMLLRCLKFLDTILQRDTGQKVSFLKDLSGLWQQFDDRLLHHRVLPPVVAEMRHEVVALAALPLVLAIMGRMKPQAFADSGILPVLKPIFEGADGEVLLALVKHMGVFYNLMPSEARASVLVPLMLRAFDSPNSRTQEELLKCLHTLTPHDMPYAVLKDTVMPRVVGLCLRTTSLVVRVSALSLMSQAVHRLDKEAAGAMLDVCAQIVAVDRSAGTAMAVLKLCEAIGSHYGPDITAGRVLPLLCPLLLCPGLNAAQFGAYLSVVRALVDKVAEKRAGELAGGGGAGGVGGVKAGGLGLGGVGVVDGGGIGGGASGGASPKVVGVGSSSSIGSGVGSSGQRVGGGMASWDVPVTSTSNSSSSSSWQLPPQQHQPQQQQQQPWQTAGAASTSAAPSAAGVGGVGGGISSSRVSGMPAPDIFSSSSSGAAAGDMLAGLNLGGGAGGGGGGVAGSSSSSSTPSWSLGGPSTPAAGTVGFSGSGPYSSGSTGSVLARGTGAAGSSDLFGGLSLAGASSNGGAGGLGLAAPLKPPPSASKPINLLGGVGGVGTSSSTSNDPFASLAGPSSTAVQGGSSFDPFSSLAAAAPPPTAQFGGVDVFAGLGAAGGGGGGRPMNVQRQQQQQQQWGGSGGGGSLI